MRILTLSNVFPPGFIGGYELGAFDIVRGLIARGHTVEVLTSSYFVDNSGGDRGEDAAPTIDRSLECTEPNRSPFDTAERGWVGGFAITRNLRELTGRLIAARPDVVLCCNLAGLGPASILRLLAANGMRPVVFLMDNIFARMCHDPARRGFDRTFGVVDWPEATRFLFLSQNLRDEVETALGMQLLHAEIVPSWFDHRAVAPLPASGGAQVRFVYASRITGHKGIDVLLDACRALLDQGCTSFVVDVYGAGEVAVALQRITALKLQDHVRYQGAPNKGELMPRLARYDALLFPTWHREPFGFIVPEAAAAGCIPVMTFGIGASEWFIDGVDCLKTARDMSSLRAAMTQLIGMPPEGRTQMRRRAHSAALRLFRFEDALSRVEAALREAALPPCREPRAVEAAMSILTEIWRSRPNG